MGYSVVALGATRAVLSFLTAFSVGLPSRPKRLARLNIELNINLVGARMLWKSRQSGHELSDDDKTVAETIRGPDEFARRQLRLSAKRTGLNRMSSSPSPARSQHLVGPSGGGKSTVLGRCCSGFMSCARARS